MPNCVIVIPYYTNELSSIERYSLNTVLRVLRSHDICFASPSSIKINYVYSKILVERFDDEFFSSIQGYNQLLLSYSFYERFLNYKYILIYQLDALVFKDDLDYWCSLGYDYYGAPWISRSWKYKYFNLFGLLNKKVGNGGFCLRKTAVFYKMSRRIRKYKGLVKFGEDIFWCNYGKLLYPEFKIVDENSASRFSFETKPEELYNISGNQLPFGCHAFEKNNLDFWKKVIPELNYLLSTNVN